ncbi:MAG: lamin tail domain-containing protein [Bacteroidota bacterium]
MLIHRQSAFYYVKAACKKVLLLTLAGILQVPCLFLFAENASAQPDSAAIIINEVMSNPKASRAVYVEIYNRSALQYVDIRGWHLARLINGSPAAISAFPLLPTRIPPGDYCIISADTAALLKQFPSLDADKVIRVASMPAFGARNGSVLLLNKDSVVADELHYTEDMLSAEARISAGISLERVKPFGSSSDSLNWRSASASEGYCSPGAPNRPDTSGASPNPDMPPDVLVFTPDGDNLHDRAMVSRSLNGQSASRIRAVVFDYQGRFITDLSVTQSTAQYFTIEWDGHKASGGLANEGPYILYVVQPVANGEVTEKVDMALVLGY